MHVLHIGGSKSESNKLDKLNKLVENGSHVFLLVYMEGCGPCNATRPEWAKIESALKSNYSKNDKVVVVDVNKDVMSQIKHLGDVDGFPTIKYMGDGGKTVEAYELSSISKKDRSIDSFINWIESKTGNVVSSSSPEALYKRLGGGSKERMTKRQMTKKRTKTKRRPKRQMTKRRRKKRRTNKRQTKRQTNKRHKKWIGGVKDTYNYDDFMSLSEEDYDKVVILDLSKNDLTEIPETLGKCRRLRVLYCNDNQLTYLPKSIGNCSQLYQLWCFNNQLTELPETLGKCSQLQELKISNNQLTKLPDSIGNCSHIQELYCNDNQLTEIPDSIGNCVELHTLYCQNNQLTEIPDSIGNCDLVFLDCSDNQLTYLPESLGDPDLQTLFCAGNPQLRQLPESLEGKNIDIDVTLPFLPTPSSAPVFK